VEELCVGWQCGGVEVLLLLGGFSCLMCLQHLKNIFTLRNTCYLLPSSSHHLGKTYWMILYLFEWLQIIYFNYFIIVWLYNIQKTFFKNMSWATSGSCL
jgi:hypothetical protein